jgi:hypothetical protein
MENIRALLLTLSLFMAGSPVYAQHICWIDHVEEVNGIIHILFSKPTSLRVLVTPSGESQKPVNYTVANGNVSRDGNMIESLQVTDGTTVNLTQLVHDSCVLHVIDIPDKKGVLAEAHNYMPGLPPMVAKAFISAK